MVFLLIRVMPPVIMHPPTTAPTLNDKGLFPHLFYIYYTTDLLKSQNFRGTPHQNAGSDLFLDVLGSNITAAFSSGIDPHRNSLIILHREL